MKMFSNENIGFSARNLTYFYVKRRHYFPKQSFYHTDHLGCNSFITNAFGYTVQHLQYLPFGELFISQMSGSFDSRYKFTAKERDNETGYDYFGARYYDSDLSNWLSVDPMSDSRPNLSPYHYCQWNPIGRIDPDGILDTKYVDETGTTLYETNDGLTDIIIIPKRNRKIFEDKLNKLNKENKLNDPSTNKKDIHPLGIDIIDYKNQYETGNSHHDIGFKVGYEKTYNGESTIGTDIFYFILAFKLEGAYMWTGYLQGKKQGEFDRKNKRINMLHPFKSLKDNDPTVKLK